MGPQFSGGMELMWLQISKQEGRPKFAPLADKMTIGAADSNQVTLKGGGVQSLHALVYEEAGNFTYRDLPSRRSFSIQKNDYFEIGDWKAEVTLWEEIWNH